MPPDSQRLEAVRELLKACSAHLQSGPRGKVGRGTGFFIDETLLLTCAHVLEVEEGEELSIQPYGRKPRPGTVVTRLDDEAVDLALIETAVDQEPQPSVLLDRRLGESIEYYAVGYLREKLRRSVGIEEISLTGHKRIPSEGGEAEYLMLDPGRGSIKPGLSGGGVLSSRTGAVAALVQYSEAESGVEGGAAIPVSRAAEHLVAVKELLEDPPFSTRRWREALGEEAWRELGKPLKRQAHLDLYLSGTSSSWQVKVEDQEHPLTVKDLPDEVSEALFQWAQRRYVRNASDVEFLGKLLARAVFPEAMEPALRKACSNDELLIRLHVDPDSELFDIPWEIATVQLEEENGHAGAHERLRLARVSSHDRSPADPVKEGARVIAAVVQPADQQAQMPTFMYGEKKIKWPDEGQILERLRSAVARTRFVVEPLADPKPVTMRTTLTETPPAGTTNTVVHYIGRGEMRGEEARIALADDEGDVEWHPADDFFGWVGDSGARLLVVEFTLPPLGFDPEVIAPRTFLQALCGSVEAVLFTRFPMHPRHLLAFNDVLYAQLDAGEPIESAVQHARNETYVNRYLGAVAEFGWFTLITGQSAGMRVVEQGPQEAVPRAGAPLPEPTPPQAPSPAQDSITLTVDGEKR
jgi:hypothetical protein